MAITAAAPHEPGSMGPEGLRFVGRMSREATLVEADSPGKRVVLDYLLARQMQDLQLLDRVLTCDFSHEMLGERQDRASLFEEVERLPFVDARFEVHALVEQGDQVACRYRFFAKTRGDVRSPSRACSSRRYGMGSWRPAGASTTPPASDDSSTRSHTATASLSVGRGSETPEQGR